MRSLRPPVVDMRAAWPCMRSCFNGSGLRQGMNILPFFDFIRMGTWITVPSIPGSWLDGRRRAGEDAGLAAAAMPWNVRLSCPKFDILQNTTLISVAAVTSASDLKYSLTLGMNIGHRYLWVVAAVARIVVGVEYILRTPNTSAEVVQPVLSRSVSNQLKSRWQSFSAS